jgi:hypothetical protein
VKAVDKGGTKREKKRETIIESSSGRLSVCVDVCLTIRSWAVVRCDNAKEVEEEEVEGGQENKRRKVEDTTRSNRE